MHAQVLITSWVIIGILLISTILLVSVAAGFFTEIKY